MDHSRTTRTRRFWLAIFTSLLPRALTLIIPVVCLPLFVRYLGKEGYGLYESVGALVIWLSLTNAGLFMGLQNRLQDCITSGDHQLARRYVSSVSLAIGVIMLAGVVLISIITPLVNWQAVFPTSTPAAGRDTALAFWVAGIIALTGLAVGMPVVIYTASQELHIANAWESVCRVATILASIAVVWTHFGLVGVIIASSGVAVLVRCVNLIWLFQKRKRWLRPSPRLFDRKLLWDSLREGLYAFLLQISVLAIYQVDKLIIGVALSPEDVAPFAIAGRLFLIVYGAYFMMLWPLWPAYGDALRRGDIAWVRRGVRLSLLLGCGGLAACGVLIVYTGEWLLPVWTRTPGIVASKSLLWAMTATFVLRAWIDSRSSALNSIGAFKPQVTFFIAHAVINLALALALVKPFGVTGVAWATPLSALVTTAWGYPWLMRKYVYSLPDRGASPGGPLSSEAPSPPGNQ